MNNLWLLIGVISFWIISIMIMFNNKITPKTEVKRQNRFLPCYFPKGFVVHLQLNSGLKKRFEGYKSIYIRGNTFYFDYGMSRISIDIDEIEKMKFKRN